MERERERVKGTRVPGACASPHFHHLSSSSSLFLSFSLSAFALIISATRVSLRCITLNGSGNCAFNISKLLPSKHEKSLRFSPMSQENLSLSLSLFLLSFQPFLFHSFTLLATDSPLLKVLKWQLALPPYSYTFYSSFKSFMFHRPNFVFFKPPLSFANENDFSQKKHDWVISF